MSGQGLLAWVERRLAEAELPGTTSELVRPAFAGELAIDRLLETGLVSGAFDEDDDRASAAVGAYITSVEVEGFRGIGEQAAAIATGRPYQTRLDPPPADPRVARPPNVLSTSRE